MENADIDMDWLREERTGVAEAVLCAPKTEAQIEAVLRQARAVRHRLLLTRLRPDRFARLSADARAGVDYDPVSQTAILGSLPLADLPRVGLVAGGTSDLPIVAEAARTLAFHGRACERFVDVGVAGIDRLLRRIDRLRRFDVLIAFAGMEGALFTVLAGLVEAPVIAVPTSAGLGVAQGGRVALHSALGSCAPGVVVVNVDSGFGAACAAIKFLRIAERATVHQRPPGSPH
jgi:NCAIR mutase (PurE)-related protein